MPRQIFHVLLLLSLCSALSVSAHFDILVADQPWVERGETVNFKYYAGHPFEAEIADCPAPAKVEAVLSNGEKMDIKSAVKEGTITYDGKDFPLFTFPFMAKKSGDVIISIESEREFWSEGAADKFCKMVLHCNRSQGWDQAIGHPVEIVPLTRPYGLRAGMVFTGTVLVNGKPAPGLDIEFEEYNEKPPASIPEEPLVTGVVKTDANGNFQITLDREGWWGIAAWQEMGKITHEGKELEHQVGEFFWLYVHPGR